MAAEKSSSTCSRKPQANFDFTVENHGSIFLLCTLTPAARAWVEEHIGPDSGYQPEYPCNVVVEHRYILDILDGLQADGLTVRVGQ